MWLNVLCFVLGIALVGLRAALVPALGAGVRTAIVAGGVGWLLAYVLGLGWSYAMGIFPHAVYWTTVVWALFELALATVAGARVADRVG